MWLKLLHEVVVVLRSAGKSLGISLREMSPYISTAIRSLKMSDADKKKHRADIDTGWYLLCLPLCIPLLIFLIYKMSGWL